MSWNASTHGARLARLLLCAGFALLLSGCAGWGIERVIINPAGPLGGVATVNPVHMTTPVVQGDPGGFLPLEVVVQYDREPNFRGNLHTLVGIFFYPPQGNRFFSDVRLPSITNGASRTSGVILNVFCGRIEQPGGQATVELRVEVPRGQGGFLKIPGTYQASTQIEVEVASRTDTANPNDWPVQKRGLMVPISCTRADPPRPEPPVLPPTTNQCQRNCLRERDSCMADVVGADGPRPQQCVAALRACQRSCAP